MRVLLIQPAVSDSLGLRSVAQLEPLGLECVASALMPDHEVRVFDARFERGLLAQIESFGPDAVGVSASFTADMSHVRRVVAAVRLVAPGARVFLGGHHISLAPRDLLQEVEAIVLGEGERGTAGLLTDWEKGRNAASLPGILTADSTENAAAHNGPLPVDLDTSPLPARDLLRHLRPLYHFGNWKPCAMVETSRGCPHRCRFCSVWKFYRGRVRFRGLERVMEDLEQVREPYVIFADDNLFADVERARQMAEEINRRGPRKQYLAQVRTDTVVEHPDLVTTWVEAGLKVVFVGYETFTQQRLDELGKHNSVEANEEAVRIFRRHGVQVLASIIVNPDFTRQDFADLATYVRQQGLLSPIFTVLTPLPGTDLYEQWREHLLSADHELFDLQHALLPTQLSLEEFYREYGRLYLATYLNPRSLLRMLTSRQPLTLPRALWLARRAINSNNLLAAHQRKDPHLQI